jgi:hypothetical protein
VDEFAELSRVAVAAETARMLVERGGLSVAGAAIVAVIDAMESARVPSVPVQELIGRVPGVDRAELEVELALLSRTGVIVESDGGLSLDPRARRSIGGAPIDLPRDAELVTGGGAAGALARVLADPRAAVVVIGDDVDASVRAVAQAVTGTLLVLPAPDPALVREAWLRGYRVLLTDGAGLDAIDAIAWIPARLVVLASDERAGGVLARLRRVREAVAWRAGAEPRVARAPVMGPALEPLVATSWNGVRIPTPSLRIAALHGTEAQIDEAADAVAAGHGAPRAHRINASSGLAAVRAGLLAGPAVALIVRAGTLDELAAVALATLIARISGVVLFAVGTPLPASLAAVIQLDVELGAAA